MAAAGAVAGDRSNRRLGVRNVILRRFRRGFACECSRKQVFQANVNRRCGARRTASCRRNVQERTSARLLDSRHYNFAQVYMVCRAKGAGHHVFLRFRPYVTLFEEGPGLDGE